MKTAFLTEMQWNGKVPANHPNMRTEMAWMFALQSDHFNIHEYSRVKGYDAVFIIFPKATVKLSAIGIEMSTPGQDKDISIYETPIVEILKNNNKKVCAVQEGPSWFFNEYDMKTQFNFYNQLADCDIIFAHNVSDTHFYNGLFSQSKIEVIPSLMGPFHIPSFNKENKAIIGGNFCRWYGGFQSYIVASEFECPIFVPSMHCKRNGEESVPNLKHLPYMTWRDWVLHLGSYKYAVHLMPTVAAGTFSLNCACVGVPCIGNVEVDTQSVLFPSLSVNVNDVRMAKFLAIKLKEDKKFYDETCNYSIDILKNTCYYNKEKWLEHIKNIIS
jgi:hypothetical protein